MDLLYSGTDFPLIHLHKPISFSCHNLIKGEIPQFDYRQ